MKNDIRSLFPQPDFHLMDQLFPGLNARKCKKCGHKLDEVKTPSFPSGRWFCPKGCEQVDPKYKKSNR